MVKSYSRLVYFIGFLISMTILAQPQISPRLQSALQDAAVSGQPLRILVMLKDQVDIATLDQALYARNALPQERARRVIHQLKEKARNSQENIVQFLGALDESRAKVLDQYWVSNMILLEARSDVIWHLAERPDLLYMDIDAKLEYDRPVAEEPAAPASPNSAEPGLKAINAHKLWALGYTGAGRIVMGIDTGVDGNHPALSYKWRGNHVPAEQAWFDTEGGTSFPNDCDSHGSHTVGTMCGLDPATNDTIGVAPDAEWIAAKTICSGNHTSRSISAFQWAMDPDGDSTTIDDMPDAIGNSWYDPSVSTCSPIYASVFDAVEAAGIAIVFSAGNSGPGSQTITTPKNINTGLVNTFATGAVNGNSASLPIASFSSRGPSQCGGTGSILIKPEASAPGVSVRSAVLNGGYGTKSGTSMACPHVVGAIALLKQAFPNKTGHELKMALYLTAKESPSDVTPGEDNVYGMGVIDVYEAFLSLGAPETPLSFNAYSDYRTPDAMHLTWEDPKNFTNGDTLLSDDFHIHIFRDGAKIDSVSGGVGEYWDSGLNDGQRYRYTIFAKLDTANVAGGEAYAEWIAGGAKQPQPPLQFTVAGNDTLTRFSWINPTKNIDDTPMDDFAGISLYRDSAFVETFTRATADTGKADTVFYTPDPPGLYQWFVTAVDNETPQNESAATVSVGTPLSLPIIEEFATTGVPSLGLWQNQNAEVNDRAVNPPSGQYSLNLNGTPNGEDVVTLQPVDLSVVSSDVVVSYFYQPQGTGNAPETGDSLRVYFKNDLNEWIMVRSYPGTTVQPFQKEIIRLAEESAGSGTFFHSQFQMRFRSTGGAGPFPNDDWFIDNIFLGIEQPLGISDASDGIPQRFEVLANYPNPFNPSTTIRYRLPVRSEVSLVIFNALGQQVKRLIGEQREAGSHQIVWYGDDQNGNTVSSGIYFYLFTAKSLSGNGEVYRATQKMMLLK